MGPHLALAAVHGVSKAMTAPARFETGASVTVPDRGVGILCLDNEDGSWNVDFDDGTEGDFPFEVISALGEEPPLPTGGARLVRDPAQEAKPEGWTRFVCFSDTHGLHDGIPKRHCPDADVLLHAGDFSNTGELEQVQSLAAWLKEYPAKHKIVIAGNHDITFEPNYYARAWERFHPQGAYNCMDVRVALCQSGCCTYLEDEAVEVAGYRIYGTPWQPAFCDWAFNLSDAAACQTTWEKIPHDVHILLAHGPPKGANDLTSTGIRAGCEHLLEAIWRRSVPLVVSGHLHDAYGVTTDGVTTFINASTRTSKYKPSNPPIVFDAPPVAVLEQAVFEASRATNVTARANTLKTWANHGRKRFM